MLAFVVTAKRACPTGPPDRVELVDEDDGRRRFARLLEQVAHAAGAHADDHLDELAGAHAEERDICLAGHGARQQRLARAWRTHKQHTLRHRAAQAGVLRRVPEEIDDLLELLFGLVDAGHIGKRDTRQALRGLVIALGTAATQPERAGGATELASRAARDPEEQADQQ